MRVLRKRKVEVWRVVDLHGDPVLDDFLRPLFLKIRPYGKARQKCSVGLTVQKSAEGIGLILRHSVRGVVLPVTLRHFSSQRLECTNKLGKALADLLGREGAKFAYANLSHLAQSAGPHHHIVHHFRLEFCGMEPILRRRPNADV